MSKFILRVNRPSKYAELEVSAYEQRIVDFLVFSGFKDAVMVHEYGENGENPHWHMLFVDPTKRKRTAMIEWVKQHLDVCGNEEFSLKEWNDAKDKNGSHLRYLAKGPTSERLVMPRVVVDDLGLMWERLHHQYHDEALAKRRREKVGKPKTFTQELLEVCKAKAVSTPKQIAQELCSLMTNRLQAGDVYWAEKIVWGVYAQINPTEFSQSFMGALSGRMNF